MSDIVEEYRQKKVIGLCKEVQKLCGQSELSATSGSTTGTHIRFDELTPNPATKRWAVMPKDGSQQIGTVSWYGPWRKYCFFPMAATVFEQVCLKEIACFIERQTQLHRTAKSPNVES
jgi:hypothetical protein